LFNDGEVSAKRKPQITYLIILLMTLMNGDGAKNLLLRKMTQIAEMFDLEI